MNVVNVTIECVIPGGDGVETKLPLNSVASDMKHRSGVYKWYR